MEYTYRPITLWPGKQTTSRKRSAFKAGYQDTLKLLDQELRHLAARSIVFQVALSEEDIRLDGKPRAGSRPAHPGVIIAFDSKHGPLSYPCDTFNDWESNVRAIALALEHLRTVDRYGVTRRGEQYRGWSQLPPPMVTPAPMDTQRAYDLLKPFADGSLNTASLESVYKASAMATHPDRGGSAEKFKQVATARDVLKRHWGLT